MTEPARHPGRRSRGAPRRASRRPARRDAVGATRRGHPARRAGVPAAGGARAPSGGADPGPPPASPWGASPGAGSGPVVGCRPWGASPGAGARRRPPGWGPGPVAPPPPPREAARPPKRVDPVAGTPFGVVHLDVPPVTSGLAVGSLVAGIVSTLVALLVICSARSAAMGGAWAAGAFTVLGVLAGAGAVVAGLLGCGRSGVRPRPPAVRFTGRGLAVAGVSCGGAGLLLSLLGLGLALLLTLG